MNKKEIRSALESMLFVWGDALDVKAAAEVLEIDWKTVYECFKELQQQYKIQNSGIQIKEINKKFQLCTKLENHIYIEKLCSPIKEKRLSQSALEVLAIIAYKQPITKGEIDSIRGIKGARVIEGLMQKGFVEEKGRSNAIGKPILYGTTDLFLKYFGFKNLKELPEIDEIENIIIQKDEEDDHDAFQIMIDL